LKALIGAVAAQAAPEITEPPSGPHCCAVMDDMTAFAIFICAVDIGLAIAVIAAEQADQARREFERDYPEDDRG
jgi:hypothetical protein